MAYFPFDRIQVQASFEKGQARPGSSRAQKMPKKPRIIDVSTPKMAVFWPKMDDSLTQVGPWMARGTPRQVRVSAKKSPFPSQTGSPEAQESGNGPTSGSHRLMASRGCHLREFALCYSRHPGDMRGKRGIFPRVRKTFPGRAAARR